MEEECLGRIFFQIVIMQIVWPLSRVLQIALQVDLKHFNLPTKYQYRKWLSTKSTKLCWVYNISQEYVTVYCFCKGDYRQYVHAESTNNFIMLQISLRSSKAIDSFIQYQSFCLNICDNYIFMKPIRF